MDYAESRPYTPGDDVRHMDWRVTARTGRAHTKNFRTERERETLLVCDLSRPMGFGTRERTKGAQAARVAAAVAWAAARSGERIGAVSAAGRLPAKSGRRGVLGVLHALCGWYADPGTDADALVDTLPKAGRLAGSGAHLVVVADPGALGRVPPTAWAALARHRELAVVMVVDPFEVDPPRRALPSSHAGGRAWLDLSRGRSREAWLRPLAEARRAAHEAVTTAGGRCRVIEADESLERVLSWLMPEPGRLVT